MKASIGGPVDRVDGPDKVTGRAHYSAEVPVAHVAYAVVVGSTVARGRIEDIDARAAEQLPGVLAVLTHRNAPKLPGATSPADPNRRVVQLLQDDSVRYDGQPIAVVVADTLERAEDAAARVSVRYAEEKPDVRLDPAKTALFVPHPSGPRPAPDSSRGDFDAAFASAAKRIDATYTTPAENHNPMEPHATIAFWEGEGRLTLYDATQGVFQVQHWVSEVFGIPRENVRVVTRFVGGAFGCKGSPWSHVFLAALAARVTGRAVKLALTRPQMFAWVGYRPPTIQRVSLGARADGKLLAVRHDVVSQTSRFDEFMEPAAYATRMLYSCANVKTSHRLGRLDVPTPTFTRAPGEASGSFALESALDELSDALGIDPLELRRRNYAETDEDERKPFSSKSLRRCYDEAAARFGWSRRVRTPRSMRDGRALVGWGMATATYPARQSEASALARLRPDGRVEVLSGTMDIGTGTYTVMAQLAAETLGLPLDRVRFDLGDTTFPNAPLEAGSNTVSSVGSAVKKAAAALRDKVVGLALADRRSPLFGLSPSRIEARDGALFASSDPSRFELYEAIAARAWAPIETSYDEKEKEDRKRFSTHSFGAHFVEVAVDPDLGEVRVRRVVSAFACGRVLNRKTARSQLLGGVVWGIGLALQERTVRDERTGRVVTKNLSDYHVPVHADVPSIDILMIEEDDPYVNEIGAKGMGEIGIVGAGAAIANAVFHATGTRVRDLPITLDKLL
ncbi:MAG: xanthine dehydrogenase family protein molybdopterin-binding subunit [Myxococcales bacterium]|nr:xanthine dehydrogenase family protein molybdopterin-binding subunit [Myxococcales bacterium]